MQLKYNRQPSLGSSIIKTLIKLLLLVIVFIFTIFLIGKITFPSPEKNTKSTSLMRLKSFNYIIGLLIIFSSTLGFCEEKIDIWKNNKEDIIDQSQKKKKLPEKPKLQTNQTIKATEKIQIQEGVVIQSNEQKVFGIFDPANFDFNLNMWSATKAKDLRASLKRLDKIELSKSSNEILEAILFSFSYPPRDMTEKEFVNLKINWLIQNDRVDLIDNFLKQNEEFDNKSKLVQYLVDKNIASGNIKNGCEKIKFIDKKIKDPYLKNLKYIVWYLITKTRSTTFAGFIT